MTDTGIAREGSGRPFRGDLAILDGLVYEVDGGGAWWLTSDRHGQRLRCRPDRPTFPAGWSPGTPRQEATIAEDLYERPVAYNVIAGDGRLVVPGDEIAFLDRESGMELVGTVIEVPGFVCVMADRGGRREVCRDDVLRVTRLATDIPPAWAATASLRGTANRGGGR